MNNKILSQKQKVSVTETCKFQQVSVTEKSFSHINKYFFFKLEDLALFVANSENRNKPTFRNKR